MYSFPSLYRRIRFSCLASAFFAAAVIGEAATPAIGGLATSPQVDDNATKTIFAAVTITDADNHNVIVSVLFDATKGSFSGTAFQTSGPAATTTLTVQPAGGQLPAAAQSDLRDLIYTPVENRIAADTSENLLFSISAFDGTTTSSGNLTVVLNSINDVPTITLPGSNPSLTDKETLAIFSGVSLGDDDADAQLDVVVTYDSAKGIFTTGSLTSSGFVQTNATTVTFTAGGAGSPAQAQAALRALVFDPAENQVEPGSTDALTFNIQVTDETGASLDDDLVVDVESINDAPVVNLPANDPEMDDNQTSTIFSGVTLTEDDVSDGLLLVITYNKDKGSFTGGLGPFTPTGTGTNAKLTLSTRSAVGVAELALQGLIFTPMPHQVVVGQTEDLIFSIEAEDESNASDIEDLTLVVTSINDAPILTNNGNAANFAANAGQSVVVFPQVDLEDPDVQVNSDPEVPGDNFIATIELSGGADPGTIASSQFSLDSGFIYIFSGKLFEVQQAIREFEYVAPSANGTFTIELSVEDVEGATSNILSRSVTVTQPTPGVSGLVSGQQVADNGVISPFSTAIFNSFGSGTRDVIIALDDDAKGTFDILGAFTPIVVGGETVYKMTGSSVEATTSIQNLRFVPTLNRIVEPVSGPFQEAVTFTISVREIGVSSDLSSDSLSVTVIPVNDAPTIATSNPQVEINDDQTALPFASTVVDDVDEGGTQNISVTITVQSATAGVPGLLSSDDPDFMASATPNVYTISGSPTAVNAVLQSVVFTPTPNRNTVGVRETISFNFDVQDGEGGEAQRDVSTVIVFSVNGAPVIAGVPDLSEQPFPTPSSGPGQAQPFSVISVSDETNLTFLITLASPGKGALTLDSSDQAIADDAGDASLTADFDAVAGTYELVGTPAAISTAIQGMTYTLTPVAVDPGSQTFTLAATDAVNTTTKTLAMFIRDRNVAHIVTSAADAGAGSLRQALGLAGNGDFIVFEFPEDAYPVTIYLESTLLVEKDLTIVGSGVAELMLSGAPDAESAGAVGLFYVTNGALLTLEQLTLKDGVAASYGGAVSAENGGSLIARYCSFEGNSAGQFGGAIDVFEGDLLVEQCLFLDNFVTGSTARAGGAISVATTGESAILNSTFVGNRQENFGINNGGGAIYAENVDESLLFDLSVEHCTFLNNVDAANSGTAILASTLGATVSVRNSIFADQQGRVLDLLGGGRIESLGGNIATDATTTTYTQGGSTQNVTLLDALSDSRSVEDPGLLPLGNYGGPTLTCPPEAGSPAIDPELVTAPAVPETIAIDQRGVWRDAKPDIGAYEVGAFSRVNINEIQVDPDTGDNQFIEFYNPRESDSLNLLGLSFQVDDNAPIAFASTSLQPGQGFVYEFSGVVLDDERGTLRLLNADGQELLEVNYMAAFVEAGNEVGVDHESITRYPRFEGCFLPHRRVAELVGSPPGLLESSGNDVNGSPLNGGNAPPIAVVDQDGYNVLANKSVVLDVIANDIEFDRTDSLQIEEVMVVDAGVVVNQELLAINSNGEITLTGLPVSPTSTVDPAIPADLTGVTVSIISDGTELSYDPRNSDFMTALSVGETSTDIWAYTILDYADGTTAQARGADDAEREGNIVLATTFFTITVTGVNEAPEPVEDDNLATFENQAIRLLADVTLLSQPAFDYGDLEVDYQDFDANGVQGPYTPPVPTVALLANDDDIDNDDDNTDLLLVAVHQTATPTDLLVTTSALGARVELDIRAEREETNIVYDPRGSQQINALSEGEEATDSFYYSVFDSHGARGVAKVTIVVTGVNDVPTATDDGGYVTNEDASLDIAGSVLLSNDTDPDQDASGPDDAPIISSDVFPVASDLGAVLSFDGTTITYSPQTIEGFESLARNETVVDSFVYTLDDLKGGTSQATVTILIEGRNDAPVAANDLLEILENDTDVISAINGLLLNDEDVDINSSTPDDDPWVIPQRDLITPIGAELDINPDGSYRYDANSPAIDSLYEGELAVETFPYVVIDNYRTTAMQDSFKVEAATALAGASVPVGAYLPDEVDAGIVVVQSVGHGLSDGNYVVIGDYAGTGAYNGLYAVTVIDQDSFSLPVPYVVETDAELGLGNWNPWLFELPILINDEVVGSVAASIEAYTASAAPDRVIIESDNHSLRSGQLIRIEGYAGAGDYNGVYPVSSIDRDRFSVGVPFVDDPAATRGSWQPWLEITQATDPDQGGRLLSPDGQTLLYTPTLGFYGLETFSYTIEDGVGGQDVTTVQVEVTESPLNGLLLASPDSFVIGKGESAVTVDVLANDNQLPALGTALSISDFDVVGTGGGSLVLAGQNLVYSPVDADFIGTDSFAYTVTGGGTSTAETTVTFEVVDRTDKVSGSADDFFVVTDSVNVLLDVLANDADLPTFPVSTSLVEVGSPTTAGGSATIDGNQVSYTPPANPFIGGDSFTYVARDASGATTTQTVRVQVVAFQTDFHAKDDHYRVIAGSGPIQLAVLGNDGVVEDPTAVISIVNLGLHTDSPDDLNRVEIINEGSAILYTPPSTAGLEDFNYEISVGTIERREATITIQVVDSFATEPNPLDDFFHMAKNSGPHSLDVLANDIPYPAAGWEWTIDSVATPSEGGSVEIVADSALSYTPLAGFFGTESFEYTITDVFGATATATITITVGELLTEPDAFAVLENSTANLLPVLLNDDLLGRYGADYSILNVSVPDFGTVELSGPGPNNQLVYSPASNTSGEATFSYTVVDHTGATSEPTLVTVFVIGEDSDRDFAELRVEITGINDIPQLSATSDKTTTDKLSINPFSGVTITDLDELGNQLQLVTVAYDASFGSLSAPGMMPIASGTYQILDTPANVTAALQAIVFTPLENFIDYIDYAADNTIGDVDFTLTIDDYNLSVSDGPDAPIVDVTTVNVEPINDAPTLVSPFQDLVLPINSFPRAVFLAPHFADVDDDIPSGELVWTVSSNTNPAIFSSVTVDPVKQLLVLNFASEQFGVADLTIRGTDRGELLVEDTFRVTIEGHPVIVLEEGQTQPIRPVLYGGFDRRVVQSFRVSNEGTLPIEAFIVNISDILYFDNNTNELKVATLLTEEYSTDENGTLDNFQDDTTTTDNVFRLPPEDRLETATVKFDVPILPGESVVVHFRYALGTDNFQPLQAVYEIIYSTATPVSGAGMQLSEIDPDTGDVTLVFAVEPGREYRLEYASDLGGPWTAWDTVIEVDEFGRTYTIVDDGLNTDPHPSLVPNRFYRIVDITPPL